MASGQCTMGAITNRRVCVPVSSVSPSFTVTARSEKSVPKNCFIIVNVFAFPTI